MRSFFCSYRAWKIGTSEQNTATRQPFIRLDGASTLSADYFAHHLPTRGLQWSHAAPREKPHDFILIPAVNNVDAVAHNCVMKSGAGILRNEAEEFLPPWIVCVTKDFVSERFEFFDAHCTNRVCNGLEPLFIQV